jgi:drug/metabolite transporter (DMT)-like permease
LAAGFFLPDRFLNECNLRMGNSSTYLKGLVITVKGVLILSPDALLVRLVDADGWTVVFYRASMMAAALGGFTFLFGRFKGINYWRGFDRQCVFSAILFAVGNTCFVNSITHTLVSNTLVIIACMPLIAAIFSRVFLGEHQRRETWMAVSAVLAAVALIFSGSISSGHLVGDLLALVSACTLAGNLTVMRTSKMENPLPVMVLGSIIAVFITAPFASPLGVDFSDIVFLFLAGVLVVPIGFALILTGPKYLPAPEVALIMLLETLLGPLLVWILMSERPANHVMAAGVVIMVAVGVHAFSGARQTGVKV